MSDAGVRTVECPRCKSAQRSDAGFCGNCGSTLRSAGVSQEAPPTVLDLPVVDVELGEGLRNFEIRAVRGRGGFGTVYRAWDRSLHREVAIKVLDPKRGDDDTTYAGYVARFERERRAQAMLDAHENIVRVHQAGEASGRHALVLEYVDGPSLAELIREGQPDEATIVSIGRQIAAALGHAHSKGIVHRDVKPSNILLDRERRRAKLADFGIAQVTTESQRTATNAAAHPGTPLYMSPEQERTTAYLGGRSDLYALGCTLYEFATGIPYKVQRRPLGDLRTDISPELVSAIERCFVEDPDWRFQRAAEFGAALEPTAVATEPAKKEPTRRPARGSFGRVGLVAAGLLVLGLSARVIAGSAGLLSDQRPATAPSASAPAAAVASASITLPTLTASPSPAPTATPAATASPTPTATPTASPSPTPTATPTSPSTVGLTTPALIMETAPAVTKPGKGQLRASFETLGGPIERQFVRVSYARKDVLGSTIAGDEVASGYTDATGATTFDLTPGTFVVSSRLTGYNWGNLASGQGQADVVVAAERVTSLRVRMGRITATAALVDQALSRQYFVVRSQKRDVTGKLVPGDEIASGYTDNAGIVSFDLTPGSYEVMSEFAGYPWGDLQGGRSSGIGEVAVQAGRDARVDLRPGRLQVVGADRSFVRVFTQKKDVAGSPIADDEVASGYIDNSGMWTVSLTAGLYLVSADGRRLTNVAVSASKVTRVTP